MRRDICIARLSITVDPQDGSYMPTKVKVSAGDSFDRLKHLNFVTIKLTSQAADVVLLQDIKDVRITKCSNFHLMF